MRHVMSPSILDNANSYVIPVRLYSSKDDSYLSTKEQAVDSINFEGQNRDKIRVDAENATSPAPAT